MIITILLFIVNRQMAHDINLKILVKDVLRKKFPFEEKENCFQAKFYVVIELSILNSK